MQHTSLGEEKQSLGPEGWQYQYQAADFKKRVRDSDRGHFLEIRQALLLFLQLNQQARCPLFLRRAELGKIRAEAAREGGSAGQPLFAHHLRDPGLHRKTGRNSRVPAGRLVLLQPDRDHVGLDQSQMEEEAVRAQGLQSWHGLLAQGATDDL